MMMHNITREIKKIDALPTLPGMVKKLSTMVDSPDISADKIADMISMDQVLTARLLKLVNSAFYGFSGRISSVSQAIVLLGFNVIKGLTISASVFDMMKEDLEELWRHSLACSTIAGQIAKTLKEPDAEEIAVAGLLHDIGKVAVWVKFPDDMKQMLHRVKEEGRTLMDVETEVLGMTHADVAKLLSTQWHLPDSLVEPIAFHHTPWRSRNYPRRTNIVHLANIITRGLGYTFADDIYVSPLSQGCWETLSLNDNLIEEIMDNVMEQIEEVKDFKF